MHVFRLGSRVLGPAHDGFDVDVCKLAGFPGVEVGMV